MVLVVGDERLYSQLSMELKRSSPGTQVRPYYYFVIFMRFGGGARAGFEEALLIPG